ncbi:hypothetical protein [Patulibacter sp. SYSU D01012]|uniref:hypothetical protein n=1 Tax=Patulibacter sp. SYSU D01012 TaxID=2817381 RepID=UPI001B3116EF|nr:hypothetical protein [Patulibacter sp. SYSU D01012]
MSADRPRIDVPASATPHEAAAIVAAVESFLRDTTVAVVQEAPQESGWVRAARHEAVGRSAAWSTGGDDLAAWAL